MGGTRKLQRKDKKCNSRGLLFCQWINAFEYSAIHSVDHVSYAIDTVNEFDKVGTFEATGFAGVFAFEGIDKVFSFNFVIRVKLVVVADEFFDKIVLSKVPRSLLFHNVGND